MDGRLCVPSRCMICEKFPSVCQFNKVKVHSTSPRCQALIEEFKGEPGVVPEFKDVQSSGGI